MSLFILFRFSVVHATIGATKNLPSVSDIKSSYTAEKKITQTKKAEKAAKLAERKSKVEEKKLAKEASSLEKQMEELRKEKEALAKMKQPKQLQLEKQKERKVAVA